MSNGLLDRALNYLGDFESDNSGDVSYCKLPNGVCFMWGAVEVSAGNPTTDINLPFSLTDINHASVSLTPLAQGETWNANYSSSTNSKINVGRLPTNSTRYAYWSLIGFWR